MRKSAVIAWLIALVLIIIIIAVAWWLRDSHQADTSTAPASTTTVTSPAAAGTAPEHPIAAAKSTPGHATTAALPSLADSDDQVKSALGDLMGSAKAGHMLAAHDVVQRMVATVDALPRDKLGRNILPVARPDGDFATRRADGREVLAVGDEYSPYMAVVKNADVSQWVGWYVHAYPLFQDAYRELGYPDGRFNDRLVTVIDHLLHTPQPDGPVALEKTDTGYAFADPKLESMSAGRKMLVRVGPDNEAVIKDKLRTLRAAITGSDNPEAAASTR